MKFKFEYKDGKTIFPFPIINTELRQSNLDLKKLEQKLDKALEKETKFSLTIWLLKKRIKNIWNCFVKTVNLVRNK